MATLFVSDLHLSPQRPVIVEAFIEFLGREARAAEALYVLGDCFDRWLGDDDETPPHREVIEALARLTESGVPVWMLHGNHDFLIGPGFEAETRCRLLPDPSVIRLYGERALIMHGDTLCTDDVGYQAFRAYARDPVTQRAFLDQPLDERAREADRLRAESKTHTRLKPEEIMDVNAQAVIDAMCVHDVRLLIHGHTHRPGVQSVDLGDRTGTRVVLGDWYERDSVLVWDEQGYRLGRVRDLAGSPT